MIEPAPDNNAPAHAAGIASDVVALLSELVAVDSVNPSLVPGGAGESRIADVITSWARNAGLDVERLEATAGRPSLVIRSTTGSGGRSLLLCGHLDTVGAGGMTEPFVPVVDGDRLFGRGAYDMKAGLAAALVAAREANRLRLPGQVIVAAVADEEYSSLGASEILDRVHADAAVVTEPTELEVATAHRGFVWTEIEVVGLAAHGSRPHLGRDAILKTGPLLVAVSELNDRLRGRVHPTLGNGFVHASLIHGGREESSIPDRCTLTLERRTLPGETVTDVERDVAELLARCRDTDPEFEATARTTFARSAMEVPDDSLIARTMSRAVEAVLDRPAPAVGLSFWADSALLTDAGIPTVLFGPRGEGAHADVEWVSLRGTVDCTRTLIHAAQDFCR
jgi:acetylornithine deacetylase